jgi:hypothetical protein
MSSATYYAWKARFGGLEVSSLPFLSAFDPGHWRDDGRQHAHENADTAFQSSRFLYARNAVITSNGRLKIIDLRRFYRGRIRLI